MHILWNGYVVHEVFYFVCRLQFLRFFGGLQPSSHVAAEMRSGGQIQPEHKPLLSLHYFFVAEERTYGCHFDNSQ